jgi:hypothetical protein
VRKHDEPIDIRDSGRPDQVFHADGLLPREVAPPLPADEQLDRVPTERPWNQLRDRRGDEGQRGKKPSRGWSAELAVSRSPAGPEAPGGRIAFGSPVPMIRHRFGGHACSASATPELAPVTGVSSFLDRTPSRRAVGLSELWTYVGGTDFGGGLAVWCRPIRVRAA